ESEVVEVIGFDNIQHGKILTGSGVGAAERDELIALSFRRFVSQNDFGKDDIVVSVPSQNSFARFVNLPPVEPKRIPEIVRFEAVQQIPFDINDVQWDWQLMTETDSPETRVGIFAIKNEVVSSALEHFGRENVQVGYVQMAPMALYNYVFYDRPDLVTAAGDKQGQAIVVLNIGAENTDLVVCTRSTVWQRCILIGGNAFTRAIADTFKLNFEKAEKLKRTAPMSKYARQIFQAMKPVFTDLASEIQRSLGFYNSSNPNTKLSKIIALGGGTKLRGLLKYLQQSVQIPVERPDSFKRLAISSDVSAAKFHESVCDFGVVYGLALQGLGLARIESNLLPRAIARSMSWASKAKYFTAAACVLLLVSVLSFARTFFDKANYSAKEDVRQRISNIISETRRAISNLKAEENKGTAYEAIKQKGFEPFKYRDAIPLLHQTIISRLPNEENTKDARQKKLYTDFADGNVEAVLEIPRKERKQIFVTSMSVYFVEDVNTAQFEDIESVMDGRGRAGGYGGYDRSYEESKANEFAAYDGYTEEELRAMGIISDTVVEEDVKQESGFVVTIAGYSPYKNILKLMDPAGVEAAPDEWGFVTRLEHLADVNSPFTLYKRGVLEHFKLDTDPVGWDVKTRQNPEVARILQTLERESSSKDRREAMSRRTFILLDPMTKEIVSKVAERDDAGKVKTDRAGNIVYKPNDYWFVLNAKFLWRDAPKKPRAAAPWTYVPSRAPAAPGKKDKGIQDLDGY
ncbi:MAG: pilus assembly protein PilM, partial [Planctomycetota bacterium]